MVPSARSRTALTLYTTADGIQCHRARLVLAARHYLQRTRQDETPCRFDCVLFDAGRLTWLKDAFHAPD